MAAGEGNGRRGGGELLNRRIARELRGDIEGGVYADGTLSPRPPWWIITA